MAHFRAIFLLLFCNLLAAQDERFTRLFPAVQKSVPLAIIKQPQCFQLLRYNKAAHDLTIEKRSLSTGEILAFTPLRMDSVNAGWFDYENLTFQFFSTGSTIYFAFEKVTNRKRSIYFRQLDSAGKSNGFVHVMDIVRNSPDEVISVNFARERETHLLRIIINREDLNGMINTTVHYYDLLIHAMHAKFSCRGIRARRIVERDFVTDEEGNLYSMQFRQGRRGLTDDHGQIYAEPDSVFLLKRNRQDQVIAAVFLQQPFSFAMKNHCMLRHNNKLIIMQEGTATGDTARRATLLWSVDSSLAVQWSSCNFASNEVNADLTFYDGPTADPAQKVHRLVFASILSNHLHIVLERREGQYYKELVYNRFAIPDGRTIAQSVIPRRIFLLHNRTPYRRAGLPMISIDTLLRIVTIESPFNERKTGPFSYHEFRSVAGTVGANISEYTVAPNRTHKKKILHRNRDFDLVPVSYSSDNAAGFVFFLTNNKFEKFLITD